MRTKGISFRKKTFEPYLQAQFLKKSRKKNCIDFEFLSATFPPLGSKKFEIC
jgi:hypothetical protein